MPVPAKIKFGYSELGYNELGNNELGYNERTNWEYCPRGSITLQINVVIINHGYNKVQSYLL